MEREVSFTERSAQRIVDATRAVERGLRDTQPGAGRGPLPSDVRVVAVRITGPVDANNMYPGQIMHYQAGGEACDLMTPFETMQACWVVVKEAAVGWVDVGDVISALVIGFRASDNRAIVLHSLSCNSTTSGYLSGSGVASCNADRTYVQSIVPAGGGQRGYVVTYVTEDKRRCIISQWSTYLGCAGCDCSCGSGPEGSLPDAPSGPCYCNGLLYDPETGNYPGYCQRCFQGVNLCISVDDSPQPNPNVFPCDGILDNKIVISAYDDFAIPCPGANLGYPNEGFYGGWNFDFNAYKEINGAVVHYRLVGTLIPCAGGPSSGINLRARLFVTNGGGCGRWSTSDETYTVQYYVGVPLGTESQCEFGPAPVNLAGYQEYDIVLVSCNPLIGFVFMNDIRLVFSEGNCGVETKFYCVSDLFVPSGPGGTIRECLPFPYPPGPNPAEYLIRGGPYDTYDECVSNCAGIVTSWWCVDGVCVQSATEPTGATSGPYDSESDCMEACTTGPLWYCVSGGGNRFCIQTDDPDSYTVVGGPYSSQGECLAFCSESTEPWWCISGDMGNYCLQTWVTGSLTVVGGPFATQEECEAFCGDGPEPSGSTIPL